MKHIPPASTLCLFTLFLHAQLLQVSTDQQSQCRFALQVPVLVTAGYRVIAPDLRGYGETDRPQEPDSYHIKSLIADVASRTPCNNELSTHSKHAHHAVDLTHFPYTSPTAPSMAVHTG